MTRHHIRLGVALTTLAVAGCGARQPQVGGPISPFTLAWSEHPSWSAFATAHKRGLIDGDRGKKGEIEEKWGVDIVLEQPDYASCLARYHDKSADAVCASSADALAASLGRDSVAILPTSRIRIESATLPEECVDIVVVGLDVLQRPGGQSFATALIEAFFQAGGELPGADEPSAAGSPDALFPHLAGKDPQLVVVQADLLRKPVDALAVLEAESFQQEVMPDLVEFCVSHGLIEQAPRLSFGDTPGQLTFTPRYLRLVAGPPAALPPDRQPPAQPSPADAGASTEVSGGDEAASTDSPNGEPR